MTIKRHWKKLLIAACAAILLILICAAAVPGAAASAASDDMSSYSISSYDITCTLNEDCTADVSEVITMSYYSGRFSRTITADGKTRIKDVRLYRETEDDEGEAVYTETKYSVTAQNRRTVTVKAKSEGGNGTETFMVTYRLTNLSLTKNKSDDTLYIINVGAGWSSSITASRISFTLNLPGGFHADSSSIFHGTWENPDTSASFQGTDEGVTTPGFGMCSLYYDEDTNSIYYEPTSNLKAGTGVSFWLLFDKGVLSSRVSTDFIQWLIPLLAGLALLAGILAIRFTVYKDREIFSLSKLRGLIGGKGNTHINAVASGDSGGITLPAAAEDGRTENPSPYSAPSVSSDPLTCRRVLERKIEDRDVVSLLFYWAQRGYIKISTKTASNPVLIKCTDGLPDECPDTWKNLYDKIFERNDRVGIKSVGKYIYPKLAAVREDANSKRETGYSKNPIIIGCVFAFLASLCVAVFPVFMPAAMSSHAMNPLYLVTMIPALLIFVFFSAIFVTRQRNSKNATTTFTVLACIYSVACIVLYCVFVPSGLFGVAGKIITSVLMLATVCVSSTMILRSDEYSGKLDDVKAVREFILNAPRGTIEKSFEKDQYLYYELLPYALLLRIGIPWSDKFRGYTMPAPAWLVQDEQKVRFAQIRDTIKNTYDVIMAQVVTSNVKGKKR